MTTPPRRGALTRASAAAACGALALAGGLAAGELVLRLAHPLLPRDLKVVWVRSRLMRATKSFAPHKALLWALTPDAAMSYGAGGWRWSLRHAPFPSDPAVGYRGLAPARAPVDLAVVGDSYTYGFEVDQEATWVELLSRRAGLKAVNLAVTSYGTSQELEHYRLYGRSFKPRLVLQAIAANDPLDNVFFRDVNPGKDPGVLSLCWFLGLPQPSFACDAATWLMRSTVLGGIAVFEAQAYVKRREADHPQMIRGCELICQDVEAMLSVTRADGARYGVLLIGLWDVPRLRPLKSRLDACLRRLKVPVLQLDDVREASRRGRRFTGRFDWHWNEEGHAYVADAVARFLEERRW